MQLGLPFKAGRGGARAGAGRKCSPVGRRHTAHRARPQHRAAHPVHVTVRCTVASLRKQRVVRTVLGALRDSRRQHFRIAHYSVQDNHLHLLIEAENKRALSAGMRGLTVRLARRVNKLLGRSGPLCADRWHAHALNSPREVRNALVYVLQNRKKHAPSRSDTLDPLSSAEWFDGFKEPIPKAFHSVGPPCVSLPQSWLLKVGWHRHGRIHFSEVPLVTSLRISQGAARRKPG
jgi:putative transposase